MNNSFKFRNIHKSDSNQILAIYNYHIKNGLGNFDEKTWTFSEFNNLYETILNEKLPFIVCEINKKLIGFTYLNKFRNKSGYRFSFENSIYVDSEYISMGIGSKLLEKLITSSKLNPNIKTIIAVIGSYNSDQSVKIHKKNGFDYVGTLKKVGFKNNHWLDSILMQKIING